MLRVSKKSVNAIVFDPKEYEKALDRPMTDEERHEMATRIDAAACNRSIEETEANELRS